MELRLFWLLEVSSVEVTLPVELRLFWLLEVSSVKVTATSGIASVLATGGFVS